MIRLLIASSLLVGTMGLTLYQANPATSLEMGVSSEAITPTGEVLRIAQATPQEPREGRTRRQIDFAAAASELGISEAELREALGISADSSTEPGQRQRLDIPGAATRLNVTEERLVEALGIPPRRPRPDFAAAAATLGVTEDELTAALGIPKNPPAEGEQAGRPPRPDFAAAAETLGVTEQQLREALGVPDCQQEGDRPTTNS
ncbi:hypothetical protein H6F95_05680 [Cyanobacteria bacterium FACHB-471]|nr:hypothetical protein [Cyanobacteria bacterium FACHB-471]